MLDINERFQDTPIRFYLDCNINYVYDDNLDRSYASLIGLAAPVQRSLSFAEKFIQLLAG